MLMALGHAYRALTDYIAERSVFLNYLYTNDTMDLRRRPLALAGWLSDIRGHAHGVEKWLDGALRAWRRRRLSNVSPLAPSLRSPSVHPNTATPFPFFFRSFRGPRSN